MVIRENLFYSIDRLNVGSNPPNSPYKPLLIMYALEKFKLFKTRYLPFSLVQSDMLPLLTTVLGNGTHQPRYPFWNLQRDKLWEVLNKEIYIVQTDGSPTTNELICKGAIGGFSADVFSALCFDPTLADQMVKFIHDKHLADTDIFALFPHLSL